MDITQVCIKGTPEESFICLLESYHNSSQERMAALEILSNLLKIWKEAGKLEDWWPFGNNGSYEVQWFQDGDDEAYPIFK